MEGLISTDRWNPTLSEASITTTIKAADRVLTDWFSITDISTSGTFVDIDTCCSGLIPRVPIEAITYNDACHTRTVQLACWYERRSRWGSRRGTFEWSFEISTTDLAARCALQTLIDIMAFICIGIKRITAITHTSICSNKILASVSRTDWIACTLTYTTIKTFINIFTRFRFFWPKVTHEGATASKSWFFYIGFSLGEFRENFLCSLFRLNNFFGKP